MAHKSTVDWEAIESEYRAGAISVRAIAAKYKITETGIRKRATANKWQRDLAEQYRQSVRAKLMRIDGSQKPRANLDPAEVVNTASDVGVEVQLTHRKDLSQLRAIGVVLASRLSAFLNGDQVDGPFIGEKETPGDLLEKLSRVKFRLIPLERQAFGLDGDERERANRGNENAFSELAGAMELAAAARAGGAAISRKMDRSGET